MILKQTKKLTLAAMFFAIGLILPLFIAQNPNDWTDAVTYAYTGSALRTDCWMAVWTCSRIFPSIDKKCSFWNACHVPQCSVHGI